MSHATKSAVVVTGVSSGIGAAIAQWLLDEGYTVFGSVRNLTDAENLRQSYSDAFYPIVFDVRDRSTINAVASDVQAILEKKDLQLVALVNNAGMALVGPMECLDDQGFEDTIAVNLFGTRNVTNAFIPLLRQNVDSIENKKKRKEQVIINISSLSGILNTPLNGAYCVSKHAMESIGDIYRRELYNSGIDVRSIRSGPIQSEIWTKNTIENTDYENADYTLMSANAQDIIKNAVKNALPASVIAKLVQDMIEGRKRRVAYELGDGSRITRLLSSLVPVRLADRLIAGALLKPRS